MADREIVLRMRAETGQYKTDMLGAAKATKDVGTAAEASSRATTNAFKGVDRAAKSTNGSIKALGAGGASGLKGTANALGGLGKAAQSTNGSLKALNSGGLKGLSTSSASGGLKSLTASIRENRAAWDDLSNKTAVAGGAIAGGIGLAVKRFADFDAAMSGVAANSGATGAQLDALRQAALDLGADSQFSAKEAADGINELVKAGVSAEDVLGGGLKGSLDLAAAGQIGVAEAAETAATAMTQFNLQGSDIPHVADLLTNAANKAQGGVSDLAQALKQGGLVASATGLDIEETTASLAAFASAGLIGSDAGTSFKTMLQALSAPSKKSAELMEELGISAYDAQGEFVGMEALAGQLRAGLEDLTPAQRNSAMATIFGSDAVRAANILYSEGAEGIAKWTDEVTEQGAAAKQAAILNDNLKGDIERLGGAMDSVFIKTGSGANSGLRTLVQGLTALVDHVGKIPGPVLLAGSALTSLALVAPKAITSYRDFRQNLDDLGLSMEKIAARGPRAEKAVRGLATAARAAGYAAVAATATGKAIEMFQGEAEQIGLEKLTRDALSSGDAVGALDKQLQSSSTWLGAITPRVDSFGRALEVAFDPSLMNSWQGKADSAVRAISLGFVDLTSDADEADKALAAIDSQLAALVQTGQQDVADDMLAQYVRQANAAGVSTDDFMKKLPQLTEAQAAAGNQATLTGEDISGMGSDMEDAEKAADELSKSIKGLGDTMLNERGSARDYQESLDAIYAAYEKNGRTLDISTEKGRANQAALDDLANSTQEWAAATFEATGDVDKSQRVLSQGRAKWIEYATAMGMSKSEARELADQLFAMPAEAKTDVDVNTAKASKKARDFHNLITGMDGTGATLTVEEQGALDARDKVLDFNRSLFGLPDKTDVEVTEHGADPAKSRVMGLDEKIRLLNGKTVTVKEEGATPSVARLGSMKQAIAVIDGKTVTVKEIGSTESGNRVVQFKNRIYEVPANRTANVRANVTGLWDVAGLRSTIEGLRDKTVTVRAVTAGTAIGMLGGMERGGIRSHGVTKMADGGVVGPTIGPGRMVPGIYATSREGILMAEDPKAPAEAYISLRRDLQPRSRAIASEVVGMLGGAVSWEPRRMAMGGWSAPPARTYVAPSPRVAVAAPTSSPTTTVARLHPDDAALLQRVADRPVRLDVDGRTLGATIQRVASDRKGRG